MNTTSENERWDLIVVGGGLEGLAAAWAHAAPGRRVLVLEAEEEVGGRARTVEIDGSRIEEELPLLARSAHTLVRALLGPEGLERPSPSLAPAALLGPHGPVHPSGAYPFGRVLAALRQHSERHAPRRLARTAEHFARGWGGPGDLRFLMEAATYATYGVRARAVGAGDAYPEASVYRSRHLQVGALPRLLHPCLDPDAGVVAGGSSRLASALAATEGVTLRMKSRARALHPDGAAGSVVQTRDDTLRAHMTLLAVDADEQARLLRLGFPVAADLLGAIPHAARVTVQLGLAPESARRLPRRLGILALDPRPARMRGAAFLSLVDPARAPRDHALVHAWLGDGPGQDLAPYDDACLVRIVETDLARALGFEPRVTFRHVTRRARAHPIPRPGHRGRIARLQAELGARGLGLLGRHVGGVRVDQRLGPHLLGSQPRPLR